MPTFAFTPPPGWPELPAGWVPSLGWGPHVDWATPEGWVLWTVVPDSVPAVPAPRPLFGGRKQAAELDAAQAESRRLVALLAEAETRERALVLVGAEYETVKRGLDDIGALEPLQLLLRLNVIGAQMQSEVNDLRAQAAEAARPADNPCTDRTADSAATRSALRAGRTRLR